MTKRTEWKPSERHRRALAYALEEEWDYSVKELAEAVGIARSTYYKWFDREEFREWWRGGWERFFTLRMARLWGRVFAAACGEKNNASATHARLIIERFDRGAPAAEGLAAGEAAPVKTYVNVDIERTVGKRDGGDD